MADINIVKYTSQSLTATIGYLGAGNHGSSYTFWINDYQNNSYLTWGGNTNYKVVSNAEGTAFSYKGGLPTYLTPDNPSSNITSSTYVAYTYALFNTGLKSNYATSYFELRQHAIPKIDGTSYSVWVGDKVTLTYSFAYTPYNNEVKWGSSDSETLKLESYTGNTGTFLANSTLDNQYGYFYGAYGYVVSQDTIGARTFSDQGIVKLHNPIKDIVLCVSNYNGSYNYYHSNTTGIESIFKTLSGSNISINCYYVSAYNSVGDSNANTVAFNPFVTDAYIQGSSFTYTCNSGEGSYTASSSSSKKLFSIDLTNNEYGTYFSLYNINYQTAISLNTTTGVPTNVGVGNPNALYSYYTNLSIIPVNLSLSLDRSVVNPGDYVTLTISTSGNDFGYVCSIDLVPSSSDTVITNFFTAPDNGTIGSQIKLNGGSKQLVIPSNVVAGEYRVRVTPKNGAAVYTNITIQEVELLLNEDSDITTPTPTATPTPTPTPTATPTPTPTPTATPTPTPTATPTPTSTPTLTPSINIETLNKGDGSNNGYNYVDLGLPSGTKWATCNVGADLATSDGLLFQFGRTDGYAYGDTNNTFTTGAQNEELTGNKFINPTTSGTEYDKGQKLSLEDDAAHANMGGDWIMPTKADLQELYDYTKHKVVTINGKKGMLFTSNINGKSIFVIFAGGWHYGSGQFYYRGSNGYLRSSEVDSGSPGSAWCLDFYSSGGCGIYYYARANGYSVRGVLKVR